MQPYKQTLKQNSRLLRRNMTDAEQVLWARLRRKQVCGVQFYRQKPLAGYIVDFYCAAVNLVVELDGSQHRESQSMANDIERTRVLEALGLQVLRFDNRQAMMELDTVLNVIYAVVERGIPPGPPFTKGGSHQSKFLCATEGEP